ncbi:MAG: M48 family metalloprotease [Oleibacter sp.]|nr:M48 family metalloprotease [Thalassolituus sp.]
MEGFTEVILGAVVSLTENSFSRRMESEADEFASYNRQTAGLSPALIGDALALITGIEAEADPEMGDDIIAEEIEKSHNIDLDEWLEYLSSHPDTRKRIERSREAVFDKQ